MNVLIIFSWIPLRKLNCLYINKITAWRRGNWGCKTEISVGTLDMSPSSGPLSNSVWNPSDLKLKAI
jgi:hypothetical protein